MHDPDVVIDDDDIAESEEVDKPRDRRWWGLLAVILLLLLLLCCVSTQAREWTTGGAQKARFIARNIECIGCHTELIPDFSRRVVHDPFAVKECTNCHTPHGKKVSVTVISDASTVWRRYATTLEWLPLKWFFTLTEGRAGRVRATDGGVDEDASRSANLKGVDSELILPLEELCWMCHGSMGAKLDDAFPHQPFVAGRCTNCHDPHASDYRGMLAQAPQVLCLTCHPIGEELARDQQHDPVAIGSCIDCHDPHASQYRGVLVAAQRDLCYRCHPSVAVLNNLPIQHAPFMNDDCTGCHEPHGSDYRPLLIAVQPGLCYECHPGTADQFAQPSHHPVGVTLKCSSCHDPHAAQYGALLTVQNNDFCYRCHNQVQPAFAASGHTVVLCIRCHTPHGSSYTPMLRNANPPLCLECHEATHFDEGKNHPVRPVHYDVNARARLTCTSSCHNPHGTTNEFMLRYFAFPDDGGCLMCHAVLSGKIVGIDF